MDDGDCNKEEISDQEWEDFKEEFWYFLKSWSESLTDEQKESIKFLSKSDPQYYITNSNILGNDLNLSLMEEMINSIPGYANYDIVTKIAEDEFTESDKQFLKSIGVKDE